MKERARASGWGDQHHLTHMDLATGQERCFVREADESFEMFVWRIFFEMGWLPKWAPE